MNGAPLFFTDQIGQIVDDHSPVPRDRQYTTDGVNDVLGPEHNVAPEPTFWWDVLPFGFMLLDSEVDFGTFTGTPTELDSLLLLDDVWGIFTTDDLKEARVMTIQGQSLGDFRRGGFDDDMGWYVPASRMAATETGGRVLDEFAYLYKRKRGSVNKDVDNP